LFAFLDFYCCFWAGSPEVV